MMVAMGTLLQIINLHITFFSEKFTNMNTRNVLALGLLNPFNCTIYQGAIALHTDWES